MIGENTMRTSKNSINSSMEEMLKFEFEVAHIGLNTQNEEEALSICQLFSSLFGFTVKEGTGSNFLDTSIEVLKNPYLGKNGHIAIRTNDAEEAMHYFKNKGIAFNEETANYVDERLKTIYFKDEIGGFAIHLLQKEAVNPVNDDVNTIASKSAYNI